MIWRVTMTARFNGEVTFHDFEQQFQAIGFLLHNFFVGNYTKINIEYLTKAEAEAREKAQ